MEKIKQNNLLGIGFMMAAMTLFPAMDAVAKWLVLEDLSAIQVIAIRSWIMISIILVWLKWRGKLADLKTKRPLILAGRGLLAFLAPYTFFSALKSIPLADATVVFFSSTFILTAMSALLLKEQVGIHRWSAVFVGFGGVVIAMNPQGGGSLSAYLLVLCASVMYSFIFLSGRHLTQQDSVISLVFSVNLMMGIIGSAMLPWVWVPVSGMVISMLFLMAVIALAAHILFTMAFSRAEVSVLAPFEYSSLVWAAIIGYLVWNDIPSLHMWAGAFIIVSCGLYVLHRESLRAKQIA